MTHDDHFLSSDLFPPDIPFDINFIDVKRPINWDEYFMLQAMIAAFRSKDPNSKVGCVFVDENNHQLSMGYNGNVTGIDESKLPWGNNRSVPLEYQKYAYVVHSEANAILHSKADLHHSRLYVTLFPCEECAKLVASLRIKEVVYLSDKYSNTEGNKVAKKIFELSNVKYRQLSLMPSVVQDISGFCQNLIAEQH